MIEGATSNHLGLAAPQSFAEEKDPSLTIINEIITEVFVEQPLALPGSGNKRYV